MTLIAMWMDDANQKLYIASDSRLSAVGGQNVQWDNACKIFQLGQLPEVAAYCGKTETLLVAITQTVQVIGYSEHLSGSGSSSSPQLVARASSIKNHLKEAFAKYPVSWAGSGGSMFLAGYDFRVRRPRVFEVQVTSSGVKDPTEIMLLAKPLFFGSGKPAATKQLKNRASGFECLKAVILSKELASVGGVPQMVEISSAGVQPIGFVWNGKPYLAGMECLHKSAMTSVQWRDMSFKPCTFPGQAKVTRLVRTKKKTK